MTQVERKALSAVGLFLLALLPIVYCLGLVSPGLSQSAKSKSESSKKQQSATAPTPKVRYGSEGLPQPVRRDARGDLRRRPVRDRSRSCATRGSSTSSSPISAWPRWAIPSRIGNRSRATARAARSWRRWRKSWRRATWCCRWDPTWKTTDSTCGPISPSCRSTSLARRSRSSCSGWCRPPPVKEMQSGGKYTYWRIVIGADGTWHSFRKGP